MLSINVRVSVLRKKRNCQPLRCDIKLRDRNRIMQMIFRYSDTCETCENTTHTPSIFCATTREKIFNKDKCITLFQNVKKFPMLHKFYISRIFLLRIAEFAMYCDLESIVTYWIFVISIVFLTLTKTLISHY